jgi:tripartite-type tricarboxylate transporter receptor subunit TctC
MFKIGKFQAAATACVAIIVALAGLPNQAEAQTFPSRPIKLIVPFPPGGPSDISARSIASGLQEVLGQAVIVENKPGAGAIIGMEAALAAPADGHTLLIASNVLATGKWLYPGMKPDPLRDFRSVVGVFKSPHMVVVSPSFPGSGVQDLIRMAKKKGDRMDYASSGAGTMPHLGAELFKRVTKTNITSIPYKGSAPALMAVMSSEVPVYFDIMFSSQSLLKGGKLKSLGVTSMERMPQFPDVPTLDEQGLKGFELYSWFGIVVRSGVPDQIVDQLNKAVNKVMDAPGFKEQVTSLGSLPIGGGPQIFQSMIENDYKVWGKVIKEANIRLE